ncbi:MAG: hypothetical protein LBW77_03530, partial [Verrucomicrobiota bacterium]|nr:hypothetical protein [Verrucomicrobiota bacterium]
MDLMLEKLLKRVAISGEPGDSIEAILSGMGETQLQELAGELEVTAASKSKLDKATLLPELVQVMSNKEKILGFLSMVPDEDIECLLDVAEGSADDGAWLDDHAMSVQSLCDFRLLWAFEKDGRYTFAVPRETQEVLDNRLENGLDGARETIEAMHDCALASVNLYGV